jgi:hypothetical protein
MLTPVPLRMRGTILQFRAAAFMECRSGFRLYEVLA